MKFSYLISFTFTTLTGQVLTGDTCFTAEFDEPKPHTLCHYTLSLESLNQLRANIRKENHLAETHPVIIIAVSCLTTIFTL